MDSKEGGGGRVHKENDIKSIMESFEGQEAKWTKGEIIFSQKISCIC